MSAVAAPRMAARLTVPFARGADTLDVAFAPGATAAAGAFAAYDFREHRARFDALPEPRYVLTALADVDAAVQLEVEYVAAAGGVHRTVGIEVPAGTAAGWSVHVPLGPAEGPDARLLALRTTAVAGTAPVDRAWNVTALLGNLAKLLWTVGAERDALRGYLAQVRSQRRISRARGLTLDLFGYDLGVRRFPPLPYSWDESAVALYHLDDVPGPGETEVATVTNLLERYGGRPHPGVNVVSAGAPRAGSGASGRFGTGFAFRDDVAAIRIADDQDFKLAAGDSFTAECFVSADDVPLDGHVLAKHADPGDAAKPGWAISVGEFGRGIRRNVRFRVADGAGHRDLFLDESLEVGRFYHVAGVIDRTVREARLYVEGRLRASADIGGLGALSNAEPVCIGKAAAAPFKGIVDEVRLSRAARSSFAPVLGEGDESYKTRLQIFERWTLPTPAGIRDALNRVAGAVAGDSAPFVVEDRDAPTASGRLQLRIVPEEVLPAAPIADDGERGLAEADVSGTAAADVNFDPALLVTHTGATYAAAPARTLAPGELPPDPRKLQLAAARTLDRLVQSAGVGAQLVVESAFDPRADDLRAVGRAVVLRHPVLTPARLAALAHRAGFSWVQNRVADGVYASVRPGDHLEIRITGGTATTSTGFDGLVGEQLQVVAGPSLPPGAVLEWRVVACGAGRAAIDGADDGPQATLRLLASGVLALQLRLKRGGHEYATTLMLRVGVGALADGMAIDADGALGAQETVAGRADDTFFAPTYLVTFADNRAAFAALEDRRVHPAVAPRLTRLLDLIAAVGAAGTLTVAKPAQPAGSLAAIGLALTLSHATLPPGTLGALCHAAGFTYVRRGGASVRVVQAAGDLVAVQPVAPIGTELLEGQAGAVALAPRAAPRAIALAAGRAYVACAGTDAVMEVDPVTGAVLSTRKVGWEPIGLAANAAGAALYSLERRSRSLTRIDLAAGTVAERLDMGAEPVALVAHPSAARAYVALGNGQLAEVTTSPVPISLTRVVALAATPVAVAITADGKQAWAALANNSVAVVDTATMTVVATLVAPGAPVDIAIGPTTAYVSVPGGLLPITVATRNVLGLIAIAGTPGPVAVAPGGAVFVLDTAGGILHRRKANGDPDGQLSSGPTGVDVVATDDRVFVVNRAPAPASGETATAEIVLVADAVRMDTVSSWPVGTGLGERLAWTVSPPANARLSATSGAYVGLTARTAGVAVVTATYVVPGGRGARQRDTPPFTFEVRLKDALQNDPGVVIRKEQYDLVMNVLNAFHPVGVEVVTSAIREKVVEVKAGLVELFPQHTYPDFRARGPQPLPAARPITTTDATAGG